MSNASYLDIYCIGDTQVKPGVRSALEPIAYDIIKELPDYVIHLGDHWDFPSLSSYDKLKKEFRSRSYIKDIDAGNIAMQEFWRIIEIGRKLRPSWKCKFVFLNGNHEYRRDKAIDHEATEMAGLLEMHEPNLSGWDKVMPFLKPFKLQGIHFVHYIQNEFTGKPITSTRLALAKKSCSFVQGHKQCLEQAEQNTLDGKRIMGLTMGACYFHDEDYKGYQGNSHWRGCCLLRNAHKGCWEIQVKNLKTLDRRYKDRNK